MRHHERVTYDWPRLANYIKRRRAARGLLQRQLAELAGVSPMTVRNLETARGFRRLPASLGPVERVLDWSQGSAVAILQGGEPTLLSGSEAASSGTLSASAESAGELRSLPAALRAALSEGEHLAGDIIDLTRPGASFRLIVVAQRGLYRSQEDIDSLREEMEEWVRIQTGIRDLARYTKGEPASDPDASE